MRLEAGWLAAHVLVCLMGGAVGGRCRNLPESLLRSATSASSWDEWVYGHKRKREVGFRGRWQPQGSRGRSSAGAGRGWGEVGGRGGAASWCCSQTETELSPRRIHLPALEPHTNWRTKPFNPREKWCFPQGASHGGPPSARTATCLSEDHAELGAHPGSWLTV